MTNTNAALLRAAFVFVWILFYEMGFNNINATKGIHLNLVLVKLLELHHLGYNLRHYHAQHHAFIKKLNLPAHFQFDVAVE